MSIIVKVVSAHDVEYLSKDGWKLQETLGNASRVERTREIEQQSHNGPSGSWIPEKYKCDSHVVVEPMFVMAKDAEIVAREDRLQADLAKLNAHVDKLNKDVEELNKTLKTQREKTENAEGDATLAKAERDRMKSELEKLQLHAKDQERLVGLARKELGEARWRDIDGTAVQCLHCIAEGR